MSELLPCPFCGSTNVDAGGWASTNTEGPACDDCGGSCGDISHTPEQNVEAWNRRSPAYGPLLEALKIAREAIASTGPETFGMGNAGGLSDPYPIRDELLMNIDAVLSTPSVRGDAR